jgi:hypothetical protein
MWSVRNGKIAKAFALLALAALGGCASAAQPAAMAAPSQVSEKPFPPNLQHAMCVRDVTGGEKTNPNWISKVDNDGFKSAVATSLDTAGLSAGTNSCSYPIDINLLGLSQPSLGFSYTVTSHVNYKVYDSTGKPYLLATVDAPFTATVSDAFLGVERMRIANEGSIRTSIQMFFDKLRDTSPH